MSLSPSLVLGHSQRDSWPVGTGRRATHQCPLAGPGPLGSDLSPSLSGRDATPSIAPLAPIPVARITDHTPPRHDHTPPRNDPPDYSLVPSSWHDSVASPLERASTRLCHSRISSPLEPLQ